MGSFSNNERLRFVNYLSSFVPLLDSIYLCGYLMQSVFEINLQLWRRESVEGAW